MKLIILAAGYATRLYPLTLDQPKPLLTVAGKPMIEHVLDNLATIPEIDHAYVVTNEKFAGHFQAWADGYNASHLKFSMTVVNDGSTDDASKLGAIGDLNLVLREFQIDDDIRRMIMERRDGPVIREAAVTAGMKTMFQDGLAKALLGDTTLEEVFRVAL